MSYKGESRNLCLRRVKLDKILTTSFQNVSKEGLFLLIISSITSLTSIDNAGIDMMYLTITNIIIVIRYIFISWAQFAERGFQVTTVILKSIFPSLGL